MTDLDQAPTRSSSLLPPRINAGANPSTADIGRDCERTKQQARMVDSSHDWPKPERADELIAV